jgi:uncharacterized membrane protein (DUF485 family)
MSPRDAGAYARMRRHPKFQELVKKRRRVSWTLALIVLLAFYGFVLVVAFAPGALGQPIDEGSRLTVGVLVECVLFGFFWLLTAYYVWRANREFDPLTSDIVRDAGKDR